MTNEVILTGKIKQILEEEGHYAIELSCRRKSMKEDIVPVKVHPMFDVEALKEHPCLKVKGQLSNFPNTNRPRAQGVLAEDITYSDSSLSRYREYDENTVKINGNVHGAPVLRYTAGGLCIMDVIVELENGTLANCVAFNDCVKQVDQLYPGAQVEIVGFFQTRTYYSKKRDKQECVSEITIRRIHKFHEKEYQW